MSFASRVALAGLALLAALPAHAQVAYSGTLGRQPIQLVLNSFGDGAVAAAYAYDRHDTPIRADGTLERGVLVLHEKDRRNARDNAGPTLRFASFGQERPVLRGVWRNANGTASLPVELHRLFAVGEEGPDDDEVEVLQADSTRDHYFKVVTGGGSGVDRATAVAVYRKGTDALVQRIAVDTQFRGIDSVTVDDFDFDGAEDFSLFEASASGPNTTSLYFLRDAATGRYAQADWSGVSLEFDAGRKRVHEHNQCCAGRLQQDATYRVENRKLVLENKQCFEFDGDETVEAACED